MITNIADLVAGYRIIVPDAQTAGYRTSDTDVDCSHLWGRHVVEDHEEYQADFATLDEAQAYVAETVGVALQWREVADDRGIQGWDPHIANTADQEPAQFMFITRDPDDAIDRAFAADPLHGPLRPGEFDPWNCDLNAPAQAAAQERFAAWIDVTNGDMCDVGVYRMDHDPGAERILTGDPAVFQAELPYPRGHQNHEEIKDAAEEALRANGWIVTRENAEDQWWEPTATGYAANVEPAGNRP